MHVLGHLAKQWNGYFFGRREEVRWGYKKENPTVITLCHHLMGNCHVPVTALSSSLLLTAPREEGTLIVPTLQMKKLSSERLSSLPKAIQLVNVGARIWTQIVWASVSEIKSEVQ